MSYIYSQALVAEFSPVNCSDTDASALSNGNPTAKPSCWHDSAMESSRLSRFGMTCKPLTDDHGAALLTWWLEASRAKTSALPGGVPDLTENDPACGTTWPASLARFDPASHSLKTAQLSLIEDLTGCCVTLPRSGLMRAGECYALPMLAPTIGESESGLLPTPLKDDWKGGTTALHTTTGKPRTDQFRHWCKVVHGLTYPIPEHSEAVMGWPIGHTDLKPLETAKYHEWLQQHSIY